MSIVVVEINFTLFLCFVKPVEWHRWRREVGSFWPEAAEINPLKGFMTATRWRSLTFYKRSSLSFSLIFFSSGLFSTLWCFHVLCIVFQFLVDSGLDFCVSGLDDRFVFSVLCVKWWRRPKQALYLVFHSPDRQSWMKYLKVNLIFNILKPEPWLCSSNPTWIKRRQTGWFWWGTIQSACSSNPSRVEEPGGETKDDVWLT